MEESSSNETNRVLRRINKIIISHAIRERSVFWRTINFDSHNELISICNFYITLIRLKKKLEPEPRISNFSLGFGRNFHKTRIISLVSLNNLIRILDYVRTCIFQYTHELHDQLFI